MEATTDYKSLYEQQLKSNAALQLQLSQLSHQLQELQRLIFGSRHERFTGENNNPDQLHLELSAETIAAPGVMDTKQVTYTRHPIEDPQSKCHPVRMKLPDHLPRKEVILEPQVDVSGLRRLGEEITEELDYEPGKLFVRRIIRPKYLSRDNQSFIIAPMVDRPLPKAIAGVGLLSQVILDKYLDHLPLNRQQERLKREGITIPYATLTDWVSSTAKLLAPLYEALKKEVIKTDYLHVDETPIKVLDKDKKGTTHRGFFWVYHNSLQDLVFLDYQMGRGREGPKAMLEGFQGHLQTDGYSAYDMFAHKENVTLFHCWAHARRKFFEARSNDAERAGYALGQIQLLYDIERRGKLQQFNQQQVYELRQREAVPILNALEAWMQKAYTEVLPKSAIGLALAYSVSRYKELVLYTSEGKLNIDNNPVERCLRGVAVGRKNYLFCGSHEAAQRSAMLYSLMGTCKLHGINPFIYLKDVLTRIAAYPVNRVSDLLPHHWTPLP
jgi:transposase